MTRPRPSTERQSAVRYDRDADGIVTLTLDDPTASANTMTELYKESMQDERSIGCTPRSTTRTSGCEARRCQRREDLLRRRQLEDMVQATKADAGRIFQLREAVSPVSRPAPDVLRPVVAAINGAGSRRGPRDRPRRNRRIAVDDRRQARTARVDARPAPAVAA